MEFRTETIKTALVLGMVVCLSSQILATKRQPSHAKNRTQGCSPPSSPKIPSKMKITFPQSDKDYANNLECAWVIVAPEHQYIQFAIEYIHLGPGDFLEIRDGINESAVLLANVTRAGTPPAWVVLNWLSSGRYLWVKFMSDEEGVDKGFYGNWSFLHKPLPTTPGTKLPSTRTITPPIDPATKSSQTSTEVTAVFSNTKTITPPIDPATNSSPTSTEVSLSTDLEFGLGFGLLGLIVLLILLCVYIRKKRHKYRSNKINEPWEIAPSQLELLEELGKGAFGKVWKGRMYKRLIESDDTGKRKQKLMKYKQDTVAVKTLHDGATAEQKNEFLREIEFMKVVGCHRNIISMVACCTKEEQVFLVVELAQHGDLLQLLRGKRKTTYLLQAPPKTGSNSIPDRGDEDTKQENCQSFLDEFMSISWQIAQGMEYLSSKGIVHRDLAARNILVADNRVVKVADFGLSRQLRYADQVYQAQGLHKLPLKWMSPEAIDDQIFTSKSDVWSYGVVLWEIYSMGKLPYRTVCNQRLLAMLKKGHRMEKPDLCPDDVYQIMNDCWQEHAQDRPSFSHVIQTIEMLMTRDTPYLELMNMEINEGGDGYLIPVDDSDSQIDVSAETVL